MKVNTADPYSAARVACSRIILARGSGYNKADQEDALQEAAMAAAYADQVFTRKGLPETKTGRAGYQLRSARNAAVTWAMRESRRRQHECTLPPDPVARTHERPPRQVLDSIIREVREVVGGDHAIVAAELLGADTVTRTLASPTRQVQFLANEILHKTCVEVERIVDELVVYFELRRVDYGV